MLNDSEDVPLTALLFDDDDADDEDFDRLLRLFLMRAERDVLLRELLLLLVDNTI